MTDCPTCEKCKEPITTGLMAVLCPLAKECALRVGCEESVDEMREMFAEAERAQAAEIRSLARAELRQARVPNKPQAERS